MKGTRTSSLGFTLIELLMVLVIVGFAISLIGGLTIEWVDKAKIYNEQQILIRDLKKEAGIAFASDSSKNLIFEGTKAYILLQQSDNQEKVLLTQYSYIFFKPQRVQFNRNGFSSSDFLFFNIGGKSLKLDLSDFTIKSNEN